MTRKPHPLGLTHSEMLLAQSRSILGSPVESNYAENRQRQQMDPSSDAGPDTLWQNEELDEEFDAVGFLILGLIFVLAMMLGLGVGYLFWA